MNGKSYGNLKKKTINISKEIEHSSLNYIFLNVVDLNTWIQQEKFQVYKFGVCKKKTCTSNDSHRFKKKKYNQTRYQPKKAKEDSSDHRKCLAKYSSNL